MQGLWLCAPASLWDPQKWGGVWFTVEPLQPLLLLRPRQVRKSLVLEEVAGCTLTGHPQLYSCRHGFKQKQNRIQTEQGGNTDPRQGQKMGERKLEKEYFTAFRSLFNFVAGTWSLGQGRRRTVF